MSSCAHLSVSWHKESMLLILTCMIHFSWDENRHYRCVLSSFADLLSRQSLKLPMLLLFLRKKSNNRQLLKDMKSVAKRYQVCSVSFSHCTRKAMSVAKRYQSQCGIRCKAIPAARRYQLQSNTSCKAVSIAKRYQMQCNISWKAMSLAKRYQLQCNTSCKAMSVVQCFCYPLHKHGCTSNGSWHVHERPWWALSEEGHHPLNRSLCQDMCRRQRDGTSSLHKQDCPASMQYGVSVSHSFCQNSESHIWRVCNAMRALAVRLKACCICRVFFRDAGKKSRTLLKATSINPNSDLIVYFIFRLTRILRFRHPGSHTLIDIWVSTDSTF